MPLRRDLSYKSSYMSQKNLSKNHWIFWSSLAPPPYFWLHYSVAGAIILVKRKDKPAKSCRKGEPPYALFLWAERRQNGNLWKSFRPLSAPIHKSIECIYVTEGTLELGLAWKHFITGDRRFRVVFPNVPPSLSGVRIAGFPLLLLPAPPALTGVYSDRLQSFQPENPVIPSCEVHPDIPYALIILARSFPFLVLCQRKEQPGHNIIYDTVAYMAAHFTEDISLTKMAEDLGYAPSPSPGSFPRPSTQTSTDTWTTAPEHSAEPSGESGRNHNRALYWARGLAACGHLTGYLESGFTSRRGSTGKKGYRDNIWIRIPSGHIAWKYCPE